MPGQAVVGEVAQRVPQRGQLPVQHGGHLGPFGVEHQVFDAVVAVREADVAFLVGASRNVRRQPFGQTLHRLDRRPHAGAVLLRPAPDQAREETGGAPETAQPGGAPVHPVQVGQHPVGLRVVGRALANGHARQHRVAQHPARHVLHHIEGRADHRLVFAQPQHARHRHARTLQRLQHAELALDGVGRGRQAGRGRRLGAQHPGPLRRTQHPRRVGLAAVQALRPQGAIKGTDPRRQPGRQRLGVQPGRWAGQGRRPGRDLRCWGFQGSGFHGV